MNKYKNILILLFSFSFIYSEGYNMQLLSHLPFEQESSDITGFYQDGREFAVMGLQNAAVFIDITDPFNPYEIARIQGSTSIWRDIKYWNQHVYIGTEADDGIKIVSVEDPDNPTLVNTITDVDNSHNVHIDSDGYLYIVGADVNDIWIYDLAYPANPVLVGTWNYQDGETSQQGYCHDIEVYNNKLYCAAIYVGYFYIIDVSDKSNPITLASHFAGIEGISTHDVAVTEDERYLFTGDENLGGHIKAWDIQDYNNINLVDEYITDEGQEHSAHNLYVRPGTNQLIISYYADGTRVLDISDPTNLEEIAYYDMSDIEGLYVSNWGVYAYLPSGLIISSDIEQGLFIFELGGISIIHDKVEDVSFESGDSPYVYFEAEVESFDGYIEEVTLHYSADNLIWNDANMYPNTPGSNLYDAVMTFDDANVIVYYYITASNNLNQSAKYPDMEEYLTFTYGDLDLIIFEDFENDNNWYVESTATDGIWELGVPNGSSEQGGVINELDAYTVQTYEDHTPDGERCFLTGNEDINPSSPGQDDVDGGSTILYTDIYDISEYNEVLLTYWRWYTNNLGNSPGTDIWNVQVSNGNNDWIDLENTNVSQNTWIEKQFLLSDFIDFTDQIQFRFTASDLFNEGDTGSGASLVEGAIDDFKLEGVLYQSSLGDVNLDGNLDVLDVVLLVNNVLDEVFTANSDINSDGSVNVLDVVTLVNLILG